MSDPTHIPYSSTQVLNLKKCISRVMDMVEAGQTCRSVPVGKWKQNELERAKSDSNVNLKVWGWSQPPLHFIISDRGVGFVQTSRSSNIGHVSEKFSDNKRLTKHILEANDVPVARGSQVETFDDALLAHSKYKISVIKPVYGSLYQGVTIAIESIDELKLAWKHARKASPKGPILIEEFIPGADIRVHVLRGKFLSAYMRMAPHVVGDGESTISQIIVKKNLKRNTLPGVVGKDIKIDETGLFYLTKQNYQSNSVLKKGEIAILGYIPNYYSGADYFNITDRIHPTIINDVERASELLGPADFFGYDLLSTDFTLPTDKSQTVIAESNTRPNVTFFQYLTYSQPRNNLADVYNSVVGDAADTPIQPNIKRTLKLRGKLDPSNLPVGISNFKTAPYGLVVGLDKSPKAFYNNAFEITNMPNGADSYLLGTEADDILSWDIDDIINKLKPNLNKKSINWSSITDGMKVYLENRFESARIIENTLVEFTDQGQSFVTSAAINNATTKVIINTRNYAAARELLMAHGIPVSSMVTFGKNQISALKEFAATFDQPLEYSLKLKKGRAVTFRAPSDNFLTEKVSHNLDLLLRVEATPISLKDDDTLDILVVGNSIVGSSLHLDKTRVSNVLDIEEFKNKTTLSAAFSKGQFPELESQALDAFSSFTGLHSVIVTFKREGGGKKWYISNLADPKNLDSLISPDLGTGVDVFERIFMLHCQKFELKKSHLTKA